LDPLVEDPADGRLVLVEIRSVDMAAAGLEAAVNSRLDFFI
jgi:hypothetical protein